MSYNSGQSQDHWPPVQTNARHSSGHDLRVYPESLVSSNAVIGSDRYPPREFHWMTDYSAYNNPACGNPVSSSGMPASYRQTMGYSHDSMPRGSQMRPPGLQGRQAHTGSREVSGHQMHGGMYRQRFQPPSLSQMSTSHRNPVINQRLTARLRGPQSAAHYREHTQASANSSVNTDPSARFHSQCLVGPDGSVISPHRGGSGPPHSSQRGPQMSTMLSAVPHARGDVQMSNVEMGMMQNQMPPPYGSVIPMDPHQQNPGVSSMCNTERFGTNANSFGDVQSSFANGNSFQNVNFMMHCRNLYERCMRENVNMRHVTFENFLKTFIAYHHQRESTKLQTLQVDPTSSGTREETEPSDRSLLGHWYRVPDPESEASCADNPEGQSSDTTQKDSTEKQRSYTKPTNDQGSVTRKIKEELSSDLMNHSVTDLQAYASDLHDQQRSCTPLNSLSCDSDLLREGECTDVSSISVQRNHEQEQANSSMRQVDYMLDRSYGSGELVDRATSEDNNMVVDPDIDNVHGSELLTESKSDLDLVYESDIVYPPVGEKDGTLPGNVSNTDMTLMGIQTVDAYHLSTSHRETSGNDKEDNHQRKTHRRRKSGPSSAIKVKFPFHLLSHKGKSGNDFEVSDKAVEGVNMSDGVHDSHLAEEVSHHLAEEVNNSELQDSVSNTAEEPVGCKDETLPEDGATCEMTSVTSEDVNQKENDHLEDASCEPNLTTEKCDEICDDTDDINSIQAKKRKRMPTMDQPPLQLTCEDIVIVENTNHPSLKKPKLEVLETEESSERPSERQSVEGLLESETGYGRDQSLSIMGDTTTQETSALNGETNMMEISQSLSSEVNTSPGNDKNIMDTTKGDHNEIIIVPRKISDTPEKGTVTESVESENGQTENTVDSVDNELTKEEDALDSYTEERTTKESTVESENDERAIENEQTDNSTETPRSVNVSTSLDVVTIDLPYFLITFHGKKLLCVNTGAGKYLLMRQVLKECFRDTVKTILNIKWYTHCYKKVFLAKERDLNIPYKELPDDRRAYVMDYLYRCEVLSEKAKPRHLGIIHINDTHRLYQYFFGLKNCNGDCIKLVKDEIIPGATSLISSEQENATEDISGREMVSEDISMEADNSSNMSDFYVMEVGTSESELKNSNGEDKNVSDGYDSDATIAYEEETRESEPEETEPYMDTKEREESTVEESVINQETRDYTSQKCYETPEEQKEVMKNCQDLKDEFKEEDQSNQEITEEQDDARSVPKEESDEYQGEQQSTTEEIPENQKFIQSEDIVRGGVASIYGGLFRFLVLEGIKFFPFKDLCQAFDKQDLYSCMKDRGTKKYRAIKCSELEANFFNRLEPSLPFLEDSAALIEGEILTAVARRKFEDMFNDKVVDLTADDEDEAKDDRYLCDSEKSEQAPAESSNAEDGPTEFEESTQRISQSVTSPEGSDDRPDASHSGPSCEDNRGLDETESEDCHRGITSEGEMRPVEEDDKDQRKSLGKCDMFNEKENVNSNFKDSNECEVSLVEEEDNRSHRGDFDEVEMMLDNEKDNEFQRGPFNEVEMKLDNEKDNESCGGSSDQDEVRLIELEDENDRGPSNRDKTRLIEEEDNESLKGPDDEDEKGNKDNGIEDDLSCRSLEHPSIESNNSKCSNEERVETLQSVTDFDNMEDMNEDSVEMVTEEEQGDSSCTSSTYQSYHNEETNNNMKNAGDFMFEKNVISLMKEALKEEHDPALETFDESNMSELYCQCHERCRESHVMMAKAFFAVWKQNLSLKNQMTELKNDIEILKDGTQEMKSSCRRYEDIIEKMEQTKNIFTEREEG